MIGAGIRAKQFAIGIDIGGTKMFGCLFGDNERSPVDSRLAATAHAEGGEAVLRQAADMARSLIAVAPGSVETIGVALPELVDNRGQPASAWSFDWRGLDIADAFAGAPVHLESAVRAAAYAESRHSDLAGADPLLYVTWSTGIASTLVIGGQPYAGANGYALNFAGSELITACQNCGSLTPFNLEMWASGRLLGERYSAARGQAGLTARDLMDAAKTDDAAFRMVDDAVSSVASYIGQLINILDPAALVIGGGIGTRAEVFERLRVRIRQHIWAGTARDLPVHSSNLDGKAAAIGAVLLAGRQAGTHG